ncbi:Hypothetical protein CINCED_3A014297 [Cinara cedri]|uniref:Uncharacterized protein n=1 Tax=Cinara cedri TaxID=506608 RepID=A0A5E4M4A9_9HEMI|nr:Hypothetical protein CINCED_3A014297 [Cinara cedri]
MSDDNDNTKPTDTDEIRMKMSDTQQNIAPSAVSITNKIQRIHSMFVSQADKLNDERLHKIYLFLDSNLIMLYEQEFNVPVSLIENASQKKC